MTEPRNTHNTVVTQFVEAGGIRFAYRRFGRGPMTPVVLTTVRRLRAPVRPHAYATAH